MQKTGFIFPYLLSVLFLISCSQQSKKNQETDENKYYTQALNNRTAAEWEPAIGTLIVWPLGIPYKLAIELAKDNHLYTMVENEASQIEAQTWFNTWGISPEDITFIFAKQDVDAWWTRDWGPSAVFTHLGEYKLADGKYQYSTPLSDMACNDSLKFLFYDENNNIELTQIEDDASISVVNQLGFGLLDLPFNNTGGNVMTDGLGTAFSTCVILAENKYHGIDNKSFFQLNDSLLGFKQYHILPNFENHGIQHIDCFMKLINEETLLVAEPPIDHELHPVYNKIISNELSKLKNPYGKPYTILRLKTARYKDDQLAAYTNSLILNKTVYVPLFDIPQDSIALKTWADALPGYVIKGFKFNLDVEPLVSDKLRMHYRNYGWNSGDALHCRTRAIWNPQMLFISVNTINDKVNADENTKVHVTIIDYSQKGLVKEKCELYWRESGDTKWNSIILSHTKNPTHFFAEIPRQKFGTMIEYYISAVSNSGQNETRPVTAPVAVYKFLIN